WSYFLLNAGERVVFRRLAIFQGGCTLEAATVVCSSAELGEGDVVAAIERLTAKSLLVRDSAGGTDRYSMLATTAEYAKQQIVSLDELSEWERRHGVYFEALARRLATSFGSMPTTQWQREVTTERFNLRFALQRLFALEEVARAAHMLDGLRDWCWERGALYLADMRERIEGASMHTGHTESVRASLWLTMAAVLRRTDPAKACEYAERAFELRRRDANLVVRADALRAVVATQMSARGKIAPEFEAILHATIDDSLVDASTVRAAELLNGLGILLAQGMDDARIEEALGCFERATGLLRARGDGDRCARLLGNSAAIYSGLGRVDDAVEYSRRSIELYESSEEPWMAVRQSMNHGLYLMERGAHGDYDEARVALRSALEAAREFNDIVATLAGLDYFAQLAHRVGRHREAIRLAGFAAKEHAGAARQARYAAMHEELLAALRRTAGDLVYRSEWKNGQNMTIEEAVYVAQAL
ncbi:MAG TPA: hypothetical protein VNF68_00140, partial [Candidatus Baltobacteraceae bacterium]|nr:hypothetical protein [Candidatus Baltobacteraceae bacterium]